MVFKAVKIQLLLFALFAFTIRVNAQCGSFISTFPYNEGFESAPAWTSGGTNSDWAWGTPAHPTISGAGSGSKCWTVGGLTGSFYNYSEQSWLLSPCFDFSTLNYPWISFKIFWEDEWKYDGMVLQYSINSGATWTNVGAFGDATNCLNDHWYNYNNVSWLTLASPKCGWTGRAGATSGSCQGGNGSLGWVTAKHCMSALAGESNVRFRFLFGSGTTCNSYDGISIDDIQISDAPPNAASFTYTCAGSSTINFTNTSILCPTGYLWNFGDGFSAITQSPSHAYATPGTYNVTLTASGPCNAPGTVTIPVTIIGISTTVTNVTCNGANNGTATAVVTGGTGTYTYNWTPSGINTAIATGLAPGTYTVSVSGTGTCTSTATAVITQPPALTASASATSVSCFGGTNGTANATPSGGTAPYLYTWSPGSFTTAAISGLSAGTYTVAISDQNNCTASASATVTQPISALSITTANISVRCFGGTNATITTTTTGGTAPYTFAWTPSGGTASGASGLAAGTYTVAVNDNNGCTTFATTTITQPATALSASTSITPSSCGMPNGTATAAATGGTAPYAYSWSPLVDTSPAVTGLAPGTYTVNISDANGCSIAPTATIINSGAVAASITSSPVLCYGDANGSVSAELSGGNAPYSYHWNNGETAAHLNNVPAGNYCVRITDANGCVDSACMTLANPPRINASFTFDPTVVDLGDPTVHFTNQTLNSGSWIWNFGDSTSATTNNPAHTYTAEGTYPVTLIVTNTQGCTDSITQNIVINGEATFYAPNAFTPNSNGNNDVFLPKGTGWNPARYHLWVFDRWGNMIFDTTDMNKGWDGTTKHNSDISQTDVYVWKIQLADLKGNQRIFIGSVTLVQ
ncbi:MAG: hypothetical protein JWP12_86 [Bacteroidetes bacterium]|nr:hypothetical protein [Bacteroidota bacterium]